MLRFFREERAQGALGYMVLAGGVAMAAVVAYVVYVELSQDVGTSFERGVNRSSSFVANTTNNFPSI